jgi:hypothetical protein
MHTSRYFQIALCVTLFIGFWGCQSSVDPKKSITKQSVKEHLEVLSSDDMAGRQALAEGANKAADYLADTFQKVGLKPAPGDEDFIQDFQLHQYEPSSIFVRVNGKTIDDQHVVVMGGSQQIDWDLNSDIERVHVNEGDEIGQTLSRMMQSEDNMLVTVDPAHASMFARYKHYLERRNFTIGDEQKPVKILVLSDERVDNGLQVKIKMSSSNHTLKNVVGIVPGARTDEIVIYSAHYDHIGILEPVAGDSVANGADDDASGTVGVIELANHFAQQTTPMRTLMFVAFTGEEMGMLGSKYFSNQMDPEEIVAMVNLEMIGKPSRFGPNSAFVTGFDESDFGSILQEQTKDMNFDFHPDPYPEQNLFYRSDNATLARMGVPAHTISTDQIDIDTLYHSVDDEIETLDIDHLTQTIRGVAIGTEPLVNGTATPSRVDPQRLN